MVVSKICLETGEIVAIKKFKDSEDNDDVKRTTMRKELNTFDVSVAQVSSGNPALWMQSVNAFDSVKKGTPRFAKFTPGEHRSIAWIF